MLIDYKLGQGGIILRVKLRNSAVSTGAGLTGLTSASAGLIVSTLADNEATATAYTQAGATIETITTLGTYAAPTATKCRFKEVDATNHKGIYELQIADARFAVAGAKSLLISLSGVTGLAECDVCIPLRSVDPYSATAFVTSVPSVVGAVGSVTGNVGGNVVGSVGSVTAAVTVGTNNDKTGYALTAAYDAAKTAATQTSVTTVNSNVLSSASILNGVAADYMRRTDTVTVGVNNDKAGYTLTVTPPTAAAIATAVLTDTGDQSTAGTLGKLTAELLTALQSDGGTGYQWTTTALALAPTGGSAPTASQIATAIWHDLTSGSDFTTTGSVGKLIVDNLDAKVSTRSTYAGGPVASVTAPVTVGTNNDKTGYALSAAGLDAISIADPGAPAAHTTFPKMMVAVWRAMWKKTTMTATQTKRYADDGTTVNATAPVSDDLTTQTQGTFV